MLYEEVKKLDKRFR